jgi:hypothetical protein
MEKIIRLLYIPDFAILKLCRLIGGNYEDK